jgi:hypothetical protein
MMYSSTAGRGGCMLIRAVCTRMCIAELESNADLYPLHTGALSTSPADLSMLGVCLPRRPVDFNTWERAFQQASPVTVQQPFGWPPHRTGARGHNQLPAQEQQVPQSQEHAASGSHAAALLEPAWRDVLGFSFSMGLTQAPANQPSK